MKDSLCYCAPKAYMLDMQEEEDLLETSPLYENEPSPWDN